jgi:hypothetical protein
MTFQIHPTTNSRSDLTEIESMPAAQLSLLAVGYAFIQYFLEPDPSPAPSVVPEPTIVPMRTAQPAIESVTPQEVVEPVFIDLP